MIYSKILDIIAEYQKEIDDLSDIKPATAQIKRDLKLKESKLKEETNFSEYLQKMVKVCENLKEKKWISGTSPMDLSDELNFFESFFLQKHRKKKLKINSMNIWN